MNLLFSNVGRRTYLVEFALQHGRDIRPLNVHVSDASRAVAGFWVSSEVEQIVLPRVSPNPGRYVEALLEACERESIDVLIPLMDFELPVLASEIEAFREIGTRVIVSSLETVTRCLNKRENIEFCRGQGIPVPETYFESDGELQNFPYVQKRILGSGSVGMRVVESDQDLSEFIEGRDLLQQHIDGTEFGLNILNDLNGSFRHVSCCEKLAMRAGETDIARVVDAEPFEELARTISSTFGHIGVMDVDLIMSPADGPICIDFNPRFGGLYPATHLSGSDYLGYLIEAAAGVETEITDSTPGTIVLKGISLHSFSESGIG